MKLSEIDQALAQSFEDHRLSSGEKTALQALFLELTDSPELLNFARNKSFDLVNAQLRQSRQFHQEALKWLERVVKSIDAARVTKTNHEISAHFSPGRSCVQRIVSLIGSATRCIDVCVFTISDDRISDALLAAHQSDKRIRIITDDDKASDRGSDVDRLVRQGVEVRTDDSPHHMHHKYAIFDETILLNGSFNWTRSASTNNQENIVVCDDPRCVNPFRENFSHLWQLCIPRVP